MTVCVLKMQEIVQILQDEKNAENVNQGGNHRATFQEAPREFARHIAHIAGLEAESFSDFWSEASCLDTLSRDYNFGLTLWENGEFCGYLLANVVCDETELLRIAVPESCREKGYGTKLMRAYLDFVRDTCVAGMLEVRGGNIAAKALYEKLGYEKISTRKSYYQNPNEDGDIYKICLNA